MIPHEWKHLRFCIRSFEHFKKVEMKQYHAKMECTAWLYVEHWTAECSSHSTPWSLWREVVIWTSSEQNFLKGREREDEIGNQALVATVINPQWFFFLILVFADSIAIFTTIEGQDWREAFLPRWDGAGGRERKRLGVRWDEIQWDEMMPLAVQIVSPELGYNPNLIVTKCQTRLEYIQKPCLKTKRLFQKKKRDSQNHTKDV